MAINNNPMLAAGQNITPELLLRILSGDIESSRFSPTVTTDYTYRMQGVGEGGDMVPTDPRRLISQPRNVSTWGGNDTSDVWDEQGRYLGTNSGATDARSMARLIATAIGGYYGTEALNAAGGASAAAGGGAGGGEWLGAGGAGGGGSALDASVAEMAAQPIGGSVTSLGTIPSVDPTIGAAAGAAAGSSFRPSANYGDGMSGAQTGAYDSVINATDSPTLAKMASQMAGASDGIPWANIAGAALGAYDARDKQQTANRDPWGPAQPVLRGLLSHGANLAQQYQQQPFSQQQQTAYNNMGGLLNAINSGAGGLLSGMQANAGGQNNFDRNNPRRPLQPGGGMNLSGFAPGLLQFFPQGGR